MTATNPPSVSDRLYADARLVALYDTLNPFAADTAFYLDLADRVAASRVVDLGCGTGLLTVELASREGRDVTGVDPSRAMLDVARNRPNGERVRWIEGDASQLGERDAELFVMTGHVAQVFVDDTSWQRTLNAARLALRTGGRLAFEIRNPETRPWTTWTPQASRRRLVASAYGAVDVWNELLEVDGERVRFDTHYRFHASGDELVSTSELRFRTQLALERDLKAAGFTIDDWYGDWSCAPVSAASRELIVVASRR